VNKADRGKLDISRTFFPKPGQPKDQSFLPHPAIFANFGLLLDGFPGSAAQPDLLLTSLP